MPVPFFILPKPNNPSSVAGHIKIDRKILSWEWYQDINVFHFFLYLILKANYKESNWKGQKIGRGMVVFGRLKASKDTGLSENEIRTCLKKLKLTNEITIKTTNKYSIITICKYDVYQANNYESNQQDNQQPNQQLTNKAPTINQQLTTSKEELKHNKAESTVPVQNFSNSNLHRQPVIPDKNQVWEVFSGAGGTKEMAKSFFEKHEATGWFINGSPITNFKSLANKFIDNWKRNETGKNGSEVDVTKTKIKLH